MLHKKLIKPKSIAVIGGSDHVNHIGGSILKNLISQGYAGKLFVVNPHADEIQGIKSYRDTSLLPNTDLAIIAVPSKEILPIVEVLLSEKQTKGFIIPAAGFSEFSQEGAHMEHKISELIDQYGGSLLGPNNIGMINAHYAGVFTRPIPTMDKNGVDFISASGATAVFTLEAAQQLGLRFSNIFTVGNSAQTGVEEVLQHLDETFERGKSSTVIMLYLEGIKKASKLLRHALSLKEKGCALIALKSGITEKGKSAAASHTGAMVNSDLFVQALFDKAQMIRCQSRYELIHMAAILQITRENPKKFAVITHAGGPAVILTDTLIKNGLEVPDLSINDQKNLKQVLKKGAVTGNPIDLLATGTAAELELVLQYCNNNIKEIQGMIVIFGSPGLESVADAYEVIHNMIKTCEKPIFPILPSVVNVKNDILEFIRRGHMAFYDEYLFGTCLSKLMANDLPEEGIFTATLKKFEQDHSGSNKGRNALASKIRAYVDKCTSGFLEEEQTFDLLKTVGIHTARQTVVQTESALLNAMGSFEFPVAQKAVGLLHKSDKNGVFLNVSNTKDLISNFRKLIHMTDVSGVMIQEMILGKEVFIGAKREAGFPPLLLCGAGGIYVEALQDSQAALCPVSKKEAIEMVNRLRMRPILYGMRGEIPCDVEAFYDAIQKVSQLVELCPEISELDLNPLMLSAKGIVTVDARIKIEK